MTVLHERVAHKTVHPNRKHFAGTILRFFEKPYQELTNVPE
ncbi:hypothetical protein PSE_3312 [Pseudovibrio sp. FO-BEG1]|nr:hypothetical protein PSE_3312 [Pseudovibrio sp. FO-BEG1]